MCLLHFSPLEATFSKLLGDFGCFFGGSPFGPTLGGHFVSLLGVIFGRLGLPWGPLGSLLGTLWDPLGPLGPLWRGFGTPWAPLDPFGEPFGTLWELFGSSWELFW